MSPHDNARFWVQIAACRGMDITIFFPDTPGRPIWDEATAVCGRCQVRKACLEYALENNEEFGIWGGMTPEERQELRPASRRGDVEGSSAQRQKRASKAKHECAQGDPLADLFHQPTEDNQK